MKTKRELRQEAIERLREDINYAGYYREMIKDIVGDDFDELTGNECVERIIDLLTDDDVDEYVKLPVDANGEVIRVGDEMERGTKRGRVVALMLSNYPQKWGGGLHWGVQLEGEQAPTAFDGLFHHYHKPTMKDVLWDFLHAADDAMRRGYDEPPSEVFDEFIAKLKEAMDECE